MKAVRLDSSPVYHLPGRDWTLLVGPETTASKNLTVGVAVFPPGSAPVGHTHAAQEEVVYIVSGSGYLKTPAGTARLTPGTAVFIPAGMEHATSADPGGPLELVSSFSPPVVPGSYEQRP